MEYTINVTIDGTDHELTLDARTTVLDALREHLGNTSPKKGCDHGQCGSCTVLIDGNAVKSCMLLAVQADGASVRTVEGLAPDGDLTPLQRSFNEHHALQCGYCTPGMLMSAAALLERNPRPTEEDVRYALQGNICRCTGYVNIVEAVVAAGGES